MNTKQGNTRSASVQPFQSAWVRDSNVPFQLPGLLTRIIPATAMPRKMSSDTRCWRSAVTAAADVGGNVLTITPAGEGRVRVSLNEEFIWPFKRFQEVG